MDTEFLYSYGALFVEKVNLSGRYADIENRLTEHLPISLCRSVAKGFDGR